MLSLDYAWALLNRGELEAAERRLRRAEKWLSIMDDMHDHTDIYPAGMVVTDEAQFHSLPASLATARAYLAQAFDDIPGTMRYGRLALDLLPQEARLQRGIVSSILALAYWVSGDLEEAYRAMAEGMANMQQEGSIQFAMRGTYILADIRLAQGRLREAISIYERYLQLAQEQGELVLMGTADLYFRLSGLHLEQDNLDTAAQYMQRGEKLGEHAAAPIWRYRLLLAQARMKKAGGDLDSALDLLDEAERHYVRTPVPDMYPIAALKARVWIAQGKLSAAQDWTREQGLTIDDDLSYLREFEHITLGQVLIAEYRIRRVDQTIHEAIRLLERLRQAAEKGGRMGSVIEILLLQALAHEAGSDTPAALVPLERALALAQPEGYVRIFIDEGLPMAQLLSDAASQSIMPDYANKLLTVFEDENQRVGSALSTVPPLVEPLSERELEVLQLVAQGLSNREISERLFLALSTVKGHNRNIYGKLAVKRRTEAVVRARELGLV